MNRRAPGLRSSRVAQTNQYEVDQYEVDRYEKEQYA